MHDKRTSRSQLFKISSSCINISSLVQKCDVFSQPRFDFTLADPSASTTYELHKSTYLNPDATQSPICFTLLTAIRAFEEFVAHSSYNFSTEVALSNPISVGSTIIFQSANSCRFHKFAATLPILSVRTHVDDEISFLLESSIFCLSA